MTSSGGVSHTNMATNILETDSEDELPAGWEERVTTAGKVYYANHTVKATQWEHPVSGKTKKVAGELPFGWERKVNDTGHFYYVDHIHKKTTYTDPRLAFAEEEREVKKGSIKQRFDASTTAHQVLLGRDLTGRHVIITGGNSGIGYETARALALHGAHVVIACRDMKKGNRTVNEIKKERPHVTVLAMSCDLLSLTSVAQFVQNYRNRKWPLHILILNAGVFSMPYTCSEDGYEATFQTNYLAHFLLASLFSDLLVRSAPSRVVVVSSESHRFTDLNESTICESKLTPSSDHYRPILAYNQSKLCTVLLCMELHRRLGHLGVSCNTAHPGNMVSTAITRHWWFWSVLFTLVRPFTKSKEQAASTPVFCATARELEGIGGSYFNNCFHCPPGDEALRESTARKLWDISEKMISKSIGGLKINYGDSPVPYSDDGQETQALKS